jgi:hypothetical protein
VLHLSWLVAYPAPPQVVEAHRRLTPAALDCASTIADRHRLRRIADLSATALEAIEELWPDLTTLST